MRVDGSFVVCEGPEREAWGRSRAGSGQSSPPRMLPSVRDEQPGVEAVTGSAGGLKRVETARVSSPSRGGTFGDSDFLPTPTARAHPAAAASASTRMDESFVVLPWSNSVRPAPRQAAITSSLHSFQLECARQGSPLHPHTCFTMHALDGQVMQAPIQNQSAASAFSTGLSGARARVTCAPCRPANSQWSCALAQSTQRRCLGPYPHSK